MNIKPYIAFLILPLIMFMSCKKTPPIVETNTETPVVFELSGTCMGYTIDYKAGDNNYYMYSDYNQMNASPYNFNSVLKPNNCGSICPLSVGITLTAHTNDSNLFNINQSLNAATTFNLFSDSNYQTIFFDTNVINVFFTDINGVKYESQNVRLQSGYFAITNVEDFSNNELSQRTKKVEFELSCLVSDVYTTQTPNTLMVTGSFAFSYPSP